MKKTRFVRTAILLLVLTLMTSTFVGGTFAKYTTQGTSGLQTARVAKWGVTVTGGGSLFATSYNETGTVTVESQDKVVAPGTSGSLADFVIVGEPEVATTVTFTGTVELTGTWEDEDGNYYCPLIVTVGTEEICGLEYETADDFADAIVAAIGNADAEYAPGDDLSGAGLAISWVWLFTEAQHEAEAHTHFNDMQQNDTRDTFLGDIKTDVPTISVTVNCVIEQVD